MDVHQIACKRCGSILSSDLEKCPYCGKPAKKRNSNIAAITGFGLATLFFGMLLFVYVLHGSLPAMLNQNKPSQTTDAKQDPLPSQTSSPTPTQTTTPSPTVFNESFEMYGLASPLMYNNFISSFNTTVNALADENFTLSNLANRKEEIVSTDFKSIRSVKYDLGNNNYLTIWVTGKNLYITKICLSGVHSDSSSKKRPLLDAYIALILSIPNGTEFDQDAQGAKGDGWLDEHLVKSYTESINGITFSMSSRTKTFQLEINFK